MQTQRRKMMVKRKIENFSKLKSQKFMSTHQLDDEDEEEEEGKKRNFQMSKRHKKV
jgi:hypothetical protein